MLSCGGVLTHFGVLAGTSFSCRRGRAVWRVPAWLATMIALAALSAPAEASGFAIREQSATALGSAFAGATAGADDLTYMFFNPAALARQSGNQIVATGNLIVPRSQFKLQAASTAAGVPIGGGGGGDDIAEDLFVPTLYGMWDAHPAVKLGLAINTPFGLESNYEDGWAGRYHALRTRLRTVSVSPTVGVRLGDKVSLGAALRVQYIDAKLTNAVDFGTLGAAAGIPGAVPTRQDGVAELKGDDIGVGFNVGVLVEPWQGTRFGAAFRSQISHTLTGPADFQLDSAGVGAILSAATGAFVDTSGSTDLTTPETVSFGFYQRLGRRWAITAEAAWTHWSRFSELRIRFANPAQPDSITEEDWKDSWFFAGGVTFRPASAWTLRAGVAYDQSPIPDHTRTPRIPGNNRTWLSFGVSYRPFDNLSFNLGYAHLFLDDAPIQLSASDPGNAARGNLSGVSEGSIDLIALQAMWRF